ncbi:MAG: hypothetical protein COV67_08255 [Nitrospinae bacterium CG11_big_fil_rev_8_21_14_0_20_56_8]|nr:MAG: hypothetical protein COV67_08255 [Nitrospinae bacterium CG11_big_fil_rev_8_21_14_0_20_56_8]
MHFRREEEENYALDLTPLIDVVFLLLIFFMVSTVFVDFNRRMDIALPTSKSSVPDETVKNLNVELTADKKIYFHGTQMTLAELEDAIENSPPDEKKTAIISADKGLPFGGVVEVMGVLQVGGVKDISVAVK